MDSRGQLLIADDEEVFRLSTADLFRQAGFTVDCARDAQEAARLLRDLRYDVLISEPRMPGNQDLALIQGIPEPNAGLPVILVTDCPSTQTALQAIDLSVLAYLVKPTDFDDLLKRVREGVQLRRIQQAAVRSSKSVQDWATELSELAAGFGRTGLARRISVEQMLGMMLGRMAGTLLDLKHLVDMADTGKDTDICPVQNCPRLDLYEHLIHEGIEILERTKGSFKSRELGDLRQRLEQIVGRKA